MIRLPEDSLISVIPGCFSVKMGKLLGEVTNGIETNNSGDLLDLQAGMLQEACSLFAPLLIQKCDEGHAHFFAELVGKIGGVYG